jgi:3-oxoacyl-[acyl-carrier protein] reductase
MKTFIVVGGGSGIAAEVIKELSGNTIICYGRTEVEADQYIPWDVEEPFPGLPENVDEISGFLYAPGTINLKPFKSMKIDDFQHDLQINLLGAVDALQQVLPKMKGGQVVMFSTVAARLGMSFHASIASAKAAVEGLSRSLAAEYAAKNICFNTVSLSLTDTKLAEGLLNSEKKREAMAERHPLKRVGDAAEAAHLVSELLLGKFSWMSGETLHLEGGIGSLRP